MAAALVSDRTCETVLGVPWRGLRSFCREHGIPIRHVGRRPVVSVAAVLAALEGAVEEFDEDAAIEHAAAGGRR